MSPIRLYGARPLSKLEAVLYAALVAVLIAVLLDRMLRLFAQAEREVVLLTLANTERGLRTQAAIAVLLSRPLPAEPQAHDPFALAGVEVRGNRGVLPQVRGDLLAPGEWAYDRQARQLVYRPRYPFGLETGEADGLLRFEVRYDPVRGQAGIVPSRPYRWEP